MANIAINGQAMSQIGKYKEPPKIVKDAFELVLIFWEYEDLSWKSV